jgi:NAD(P)-dependent dehydrogenase (short-subunit alcohol dehydrogenase family)
VVSFDVQGRRVVVVGAHTGLGYVLAREFAEAGAIVSIVAEVPDVRRAAEELTLESGSPIASAVCDISDRSAVIELAERLGPVDVLVNNAALTVETPFDDDSDEAARRFRRTLDINIAGSYWMAQEISKRMTDGGRIIFTASFWGKTAGAGYSAYVASKHGVIGLVRTLAIELGGRGISVNAVCPHAIRTAAALEAPPDVVESATRHMVLRPGLIPPEDIAGIYLFLASPAAAQITGQALSVDRGAALF